MLVDLSNIIKPNDKIAVALSGGCDSMCLMHFLCQSSLKLNFKVVAINVEHGIRGESSISDTEFVKDYCKKQNVPLLTYSVDAPAFAKQNKLSIEQSARILRYDCFMDALSKGACDKVATAHHRDDNVETVLFNVFRGTGLRGLIGINKAREDGVIRPFLSIDRAQIEEYARANGVPFVTDETNLKDDYTRNNIRHNVLPRIKELFPELNASVERLSELAKTDDDYLTGVAKSLVDFDGQTASIPLPCHPAIFSRAIIIALKAMGVKKDWEKAHVDLTVELASLANGSRLSLLNGITAVKEYDKIVFYTPTKKSQAQLPFSPGEHTFAGKTLKIESQALVGVDLKSGLYIDLDKVPKTAVIRARREGDIFTKFGGGTKLLNDYFTDKKVPLRERDGLALIADGNQVLAIFGLSISDRVKVDCSTARLARLV